MSRSSRCDVLPLLTTGVGTTCVSALPMSVMTMRPPTGTASAVASPASAHARAAQAAATNVAATAQAETAASHRELHGILWGVFPISAHGAGIAGGPEAFGAAAGRMTTPIRLMLILDDPEV